MGFGNRINTKHLLAAAAFTLILFTIALDLVLLSELKGSYEDTKSIIAKIAESEDSGKNLIKWLKETPDENWLLQGKEFLSFYGYDESAKTVWDEKYLAAKNKIIILSAVFDALLLLFLFFLLRFIQEKEKRQILEIEKALRQLQTTDCGSFPFSREGPEAVLRDRLYSLQEQIRMDHAKLQEEKESTKAFVTDISHQLKTPVAALKTNLELLSSEEMTRMQQQKFLQRCTSQLEGLENLTKALVNVSRMETGMIQIQIKPAEIEETILAAVSRIYEKAAQKQISIEMSPDSVQKSVIIPHDQKWTAEVLINLLDNAIKYSPAGACIVIKTESLMTYFRIDIQDEGIGVSKSECHKIFRRFYRSESVKDIEGSGVGLYLAREIMEKQNGSVFVHSGQNRKGSVFSIQLPKA